MICQESPCLHITLGNPAQSHAKSRVPTSDNYNMISSSFSSFNSVRRLYSQSFFLLHLMIFSTVFHQNTSFFSPQIHVSSDRIRGSFNRPNWPAILVLHRISCLQRLFPWYTEELHFAASPRMPCLVCRSSLNGVQIGLLGFSSSVCLRSRFLLDPNLGQRNCAATLLGLDEQAICAQD